MSLFKFQAARSSGEGRPQPVPHACAAAHQDLRGLQGASQPERDPTSQAHIRSSSSNFILFYADCAAAAPAALPEHARNVRVPPSADRPGQERAVATAAHGNNNGKFATAAAGDFPAGLAAVLRAAAAAAATAGAPALHERQRRQERGIRHAPANLRGGVQGRRELKNFDK